MAVSLCTALLGCDALLASIPTHAVLLLLISYFRGRRIIDEILKELTANMNLGAAERVLLTGCSAGGLATYLHTDYVHEQLNQYVCFLLSRSAALHGFSIAAVQQATDCRFAYSHDAAILFVPSKDRTEFEKVRCVFNLWIFLAAQHSGRNARVPH